MDSKWTGIAAPSSTLRVEPTAWVAGWLGFDPGNPDNTNWAAFTDPKKTKFARYTTPGVYLCPADQSAVIIGGQRIPRVRKLSISQALGPGTWFDPAGFGANDKSRKYRVYPKASSITTPGPAMCYVLLDEHPDGINAGGFANMMVESPPAPRVIDVPASYHIGAGGISFADGHAEIRKWVDPLTKPPVHYNNNLQLNYASPNNQDMMWSSDRTSSRNK